MEAFCVGMNDAHRAFAWGCGDSMFGTGVCSGGLVDCSFDVLMSGDEFVDMFVEYMVEHYVTCGGLWEARRMLGLVVDGMSGCRLGMRGVLCRLFRGESGKSRSRFAGEVVRSSSVSRFVPIQGNSSRLCSLSTDSIR